jgi:hypothetical protein
MEEIYNQDEPALSHDELLEMKRQHREAAYNAGKPKGWVWNEETPSWVPPFPPPDQYPYLWNEDTLDWDPFPGYPRESNQVPVDSVDK